MRLSAPVFLVSIAGLIWMWRARRTSAGSAHYRRTGWRLGSMVLLIGSLSGLEVRGGESPVAATFVLDRSDSTAAWHGAALDRVNAMADAMRHGDQAGLVVFGAGAAIEQRPGPALRVGTISTRTNGAGTNLEEAIRVARTTLPAGGGRLVVFSDGRQTGGDVLLEAARAAVDGTPIDVVLPPAASERTVFEVVRVAAPGVARTAEPFAVAVTVRGTPGVVGEVVLARDGGSEMRRELTMPAAGVALAVFSVRADRSGVEVLEATAGPLEGRGDFDAAPRVAGAVVAIAGELQVLHVAASPGPLEPVLARGGMTRRRIAPGALPRSAAALGAYDAVVLDDVHADALDAAQAASLTAYVEQQGGGLVVLGGPESLEPGALAGSPLGALLPVDFRPRSGARAPALGLVIAFDKSGSMDDRVDGVPRIEFARQAVRRVLDVVPASDAVGVIAFDADADVVAPLESGHDALELGRALAAVQPGGATAMAPAITLAAQWLRDPAWAALERRHVLLVSDGRTPDADAARARALVQAGGFELSVVALGDDADRRGLEELARLSGGRAYFPRDIRELPALVARESARVAGERVVNEPLRPGARPHPIWAGIETGSLPELGGYVVGVAKPSADVALGSPLDDPILATWRAGLGKVAVYSADLRSVWSAGFLGWEHAGRLWIQTLQWTARQVRDQSLYATLREEGDGIRLVVDATSADGASLNGLEGRAVVRTPQGDTLPVTLDPTAPGRYEAGMTTPEQGPYVITVAMTRPDGGDEGRLVRGFYASADREYRSTASDHDSLTRIVELTGGRVLAADESPFGPASRRPGYVPLRPWLAAAALFLFLAEVLLPPTVAPRGFLRRRRPDGPRSAAA